MCPSIFWVVAEDIPDCGLLLIFWVMAEDNLNCARGYSKLWLRIIWIESEDILDCG